ncbi:pantoate--beta-alanine ligase [Palleronia caenipelagi]|uniref:Pantothenate synthetase n=1 Tax=Palleronia caenipelagi TaxID=2489174 RepID=A0A547PLS0_9RHOB|nr:pantoate--beta-alanine ligase [Palleronia caenipelagi]TRD15077.1 pantoate--beta-alanine ligase [Palleronia caenipelagi]
MEICRTKAEIRAARAAMGTARVGLVPTMGYLHDGHLSLVRAARESCEKVIVTIFVNPTQFGPNEDLETYPRDEARDLALLEAEGVDTVFLPDPAEMYAADAETIVETTELSGVLIGAIRPGHFRGVATVVTKLFNITRPDAAFFGQKDYQQLCVIRRMVWDLDMDIDITGVPIRREEDGLAMSSRNVRLSEDQRAEAPALHQALLGGAGVLGQGGDVAAAETAIRARLEAARGSEIRSIDIRDAEDLSPVTGVPRRPVVMLLAVSFGDVFLIDNMVVPD